jgi:hypothetical protein
MARAKLTANERLAKLPGTSAKTRLRKLVCSEECGYPPMRVSRAAIEQGLPTCVCGAQFWPWDLEDLALAVSAGSMSAETWASHPLVVEFGRELDKVERGQHGHRKHADRLDGASAIATLRVTSSVASDNATARLNAARAGGAARAARAAGLPVPTGRDAVSVVAPVDDGIPF